MRIIAICIFLFSTLFGIESRQLYYIADFENGTFGNCEIYPHDYGKNSDELLALLYADIIGSYKIVNKKFRQIDGYCNSETPISAQHLYKLAFDNYNAAVLSLTVLPKINSNNAVALEEYGVEFIEPFVFSNPNKENIKKIDSNKQLSAILANRLFLLFQDGRSDRNCLNQETGVFDNDKVDINIKHVEKNGFMNTAIKLKAIFQQKH